MNRSIRKLKKRATNQSTHCRNCNRFLYSSVCNTSISIVCHFYYKNIGYFQDRVQVKVKAKLQLRLETKIHFSTRTNAVLGTQITFFMNKLKETGKLAKATSFNFQ